MADINKTVAIIFESDSSAAKTDVNALSIELSKLETAATPSKLTPVNEAIKSVGESAGLSKTAAAELGTGLRNLAADAGAPQGALNSIDSIMAKLGESGTGSVVLAAAAITAFTVALASAGRDAFEFKTKLDNLTDGTANSDDAFRTVQTAANELELDITSLSAAYSRYLVDLQNTEIDAKTAENAFIGITAAVKGQGGDLGEAEKKLKDFIKAASDGEIDLKDLEGKINDIPGALRIFSTALGVSVEDLKTLAENGRIGKEEIGIFAQAMRDEDYGSITPVKDAWNELWNTLKSIAIDLGAEGVVTAAFWTLEKAIRGITFAAIATDEFVIGLGKTLANIAFTLSSRDFSGFGDRQAEIFDAFGKNVSASREKLLGLEEDFKKDSGAGTKYAEIAAGIKNVGTAAEESSTSITNMDRASKDLDKSLRELGLDPKKFQAPIADVLKSFEELAANPAVRGDQLLSGLLVTLDKIKNGPTGGSEIEAVGYTIDRAFERGALSASEYAAATNALEVKQNRLWDQMIRTTGSVSDQKREMDKTAEAARKAAEDADKFKLAMEQLASNERIKLIEAKVSLNIADIEAQTKIIEATFSSIDESVKSTDALLGSLFGKLGNNDLSFSDKFQIERQISLENDRRKEALDLQKELTRATIEEIQARTRAFATGDALIKVDGAGLQPHLEAFMFQILRAIQVRVNADGLKLLLGT